MSEQEGMNVAEAAAYLRLHRTTVSRLVKQGKVPHRMVGTAPRFSREALSRWLAGENVWATDNPGAIVGDCAICGRPVHERGPAQVGLATLQVRGALIHYYPCVDGDDPRLAAFNARYSAPTAAPSAPHPRLKPKIIGHRPAQTMDGRLVHMTPLGGR